MTDTYRKLMCYGGKIIETSGYKHDKDYYICAPGKTALDALYLRRDGSVGKSTISNGAHENTRGFWESYEEANTVLAEFQKRYRTKRLKDKKKTDKITANKGRSPLIRAGLFKTK